MKQAFNYPNEHLKGFSTLEAAGKNLKIILLLLVFALLSGTATYGGHSTLDRIDPNFNVNIQTNSFASKAVAAIKVLPNDKILVSGAFNSYNGQPVSGLVRLNPDGTLDSTFNNNLFGNLSYPNVILPLPDGKILLRGFRLTLAGQTQPTKDILRLNADGTLDTSFNFSVNSSDTSGLAVDAGGRVYVTGFFQVTENGNNVNRGLIRLNADGSHDSTFIYQNTRTVDSMAAQNNKLIISTAQGNGSGTQYIVIRVNDDGSPDNSFPVKILPFANKRLFVQPDNKILAVTDRRMLRLNENGDDDTGFQTSDYPIVARSAHLAADGRVTVAYGNSSNPGFTIFRVLPNGAPDPTFTTYVYTLGLMGAFGVQSNGSVIIGDDNPGGNTPLNNNGFIRLTPGGAVDTTFMPGSTGFLNVNPGSVRALAVQSDNKILVGGRFDMVGGMLRAKIARVNADSTPDPSFQITIGNNGGNYFSQVIDVFNIRQQPDGKILVTGAFTYFISDVQRINFVRLNADGSIDPTFIPGINVPEFFSPNGGGQNRFALQPDGKIFLGGGRISATAPTGLNVAWRFNTNGTLDNSFSGQLYTSANLVYIYDVALQADGKILVGGNYNTGSGIKSFLARLNSNGSIDSTFQVPEETDKQISAVKVLASGKILILKMTFATPYRSLVQRLNADGSTDSTFNTAGAETNGRANALLVLPSNRIMVGGKFTTYGGQPRTNLFKLNEDGSLDSTSYTVDQEVLCLTLDNQDQVLVGGSFTTIGIGGQSLGRTLAARIISSVVVTRTRFDFDGDGRADISTFMPNTGDWALLRSQGNQPLVTHFGANGDRHATADFDGDHKSDIAVYRPSEGVWYLMRSTAGFAAIRWGTGEDKPVAADYDGDGKGDVAVWRPSNGYWYILQSTNGQMNAVQFGAQGDVPLADADFDGDAKADIAVWRPSNGTFYWLSSLAGNQFRATQFGTLGDIPSVGDFNGDGKTDFVVYRPTEGNWYQFLSPATANGSYTFAAIKFGINGDEPVAADYNGDNKTDIAVRRQGVWHILLSNQGYSGVTFGNADAQAVAALPTN